MKQRLTTLLSLLMLVSVVFGAGYYMGTQEQRPAAAQDTAAHAEFEPVFEAWDLLHELYVDPLDDQVLVDGMLTGLMEAAGDDNTDYMNPDRYNQAVTNLQGNYEGIGATVEQDPDTGALVIVRPFPGSPAEAAGLLSGDAVIAVDGKDVVGMDLTAIINMVKGPAGTDVVLTVERGDQPETLDITVTRQRIELPTMEYEILDDDIGYILLYSFGANTANEVRDALVAMEVDTLDGLILDMRGNTGGYLDTLLEITSMFVEEGTIFVQRDESGEDRIQAYGNPVAPDVPMVVLVDEFSASASEVVMGTLQDYERATTVGTQTFGKGSVQTWHDLSNGGGIRITRSRWYTPEGRSVEPDGLQPDIELEYEPPAEGDPYDRAEDNQIQFAIDFLNGDVEAPADAPIAEATAP
jgi:carboxyl-terminal processing protease